MKQFSNLLLVSALILAVFATESFAAPDAVLRKRISTDIKKLHSPEMKIVDDSQSTNDPKLVIMVIKMNLAALGGKCENVKIPATSCNQFLDEFEGYISDNYVSYSEMKPWFDKIKPFVN